MKLSSFWGNNLQRITHKKSGLPKIEVGVVIEEFSKTMTDGSNIILVKALLGKSKKPTVIKKEDVLEITEIGLAE